MKNKLPNDDYLEIQQLVGRYQWMVDEGRAEEWADLYTNDGSFCRDGMPPVQGRDALKEVPRFVKVSWNGTLRHLSGSLYIEPGERAGEAITRYYNFVTTWTDAIPKMFTFALSELTLVRDGGEWRIHVHRVRELVPPLSTEVVQETK
jgi:hypothetical protein